MGKRGGRLLGVRLLLQKLLQAYVFCDAAVTIACDVGHYISKSPNCQIFFFQLFMNFAQVYMSKSVRNLGFQTKF